MVDAGEWCQRSPTPTRFILQAPVREHPDDLVVSAFLGLSLAAVPVASAHAPNTTRSRPARCVPALLPTGLFSSTRRFGCTLVRHPALPDHRLPRGLLAPGPRFLAHMEERLSLRRFCQPPERSVGLRRIVRPQRRDRRVQVPALERAMLRRCRAG